MCFICNLLDKSLPTPKQLARAYFETMLVGVESSTHYEVIENKMDEIIQNSKLDSEGVKKYQQEFQEEYNKIKGMGWNTST